MTRRASQRFPYHLEPTRPSSAYPDRLSVPRPRIHIRLTDGDRSVRAVFANVELEVGKWTLSDFYAGFSDSPDVVRTLGQNGFFDRFEITFNRRGEVLTLKELAAV